MNDEHRNAYLGIGDRLPDLRLPSIAGGELALASLRGKFVLLYLWASW